ncbi:PD40 domain-containing protein [Anaeromyxobacter diazotrophicus]|uniref:Protein TolB n=1 Tax=Anaeromyxobacter diazotrophicus TaxID=2590199 RepID=A0A7I9VGV0_9BACT|nr:PD40 domain-containing protein [Anaeromyxobacter diazotrophicus]GEJ55622.1 protein TolB [Anaeromyxobacter diazotrophicus]
MTLRPLLLLAAALPTLAAAQPRPYIEVGSANFRPLPIAVAAFRAEPGAEAAAAELTEVLRGDLRLSGLFDVLDPKGFLADPGEGLTAPTIRFARWADVGADGLAKAVVRRAGGELSVDFHLFEVRAGREVLAQAPRGAVEAGRSLAHQLADAVVQYYTREPGVFRTRILAMRHAGAGGRELVAFDVDGQRPEVLYRDPGLILLPSWRPDGKAVLFTSYRGGRPELWTLDLATRRTQRLVALGDLTTGGVYSPDGRHVAFTASVNGNSDVWVVNADGSDPRRLTSDPAIDGSPTWSPDGKRLCFVSNRAGNPHLYLMNADGSGQRRLTFQGTYNQTPHWSPRGDFIAFTGRDERKVFDVFLVAPETGHIQRVTQDQGRTNEEPTWAPNGRLLAFTSDRQGRPQLVVSNVSGDRQTLVTAPGAALGTPAWGPFPQ